MENCVAPGLDEFDVLLEVVLSLVRVNLVMVWWIFNKILKLLIFFRETCDFAC